MSVRKLTIGQRTLTFDKGNALRGNSRAETLFPNGYGASILIENSDRLKYEVAVINPVGSIDYDTGITGDVLRFLSEDELLATLVKIESL